MPDKQRRVSETLIKTMIKESGKGLTLEQLLKKLNKDKIIHNETLVQGYLEIARESWLAVGEDGVMTVRSGGVITTLYRVSDFNDPSKATIEEIPYSSQVEQDDPLAKRSKIQAVKAARSHWHQTTYKATLAAWDAMDEAARA